MEEESGAGAPPISFLYGTRQLGFLWARTGGEGGRRREGEKREKGSEEGQNMGQSKTELDRTGRQREAPHWLVRPLPQGMCCSYTCGI
jgi:hypothetical protein